MEENQHHLYISCKACKGNFVVLNVWFLFLKLFGELNSFFIYENIFPNFWTEIEGSFRNIVHYVYRGYTKIPIFSEIALFCYLCKNISCNFMRLVITYLKYLDNKTQDVSMMNRGDWPKFFPGVIYKITVCHFERWQFVILKTTQTSFVLILYFVVILIALNHLIQISRQH